ncbi:FAS1-like dehydratase domain-containing protein [Lichenicoccus sp.]|uniref:FAS1-like dehydratase domain-containing protein n=1 Tax=Lichenicoccus sp. TaxID=2781899 RepID=UPI003D0B9DA8
MPIDLDYLSSWTGRTVRSTDVISVELTRRYNATLGEFSSLDSSASVGAMAPAGIHWCLAPLVADKQSLDRDGHPMRGDLIPPVPLPRRMWAAGSLQFLDTLLVGDEVTRQSTVKDLVLKEGRSGPLVFLTVSHASSTTRGDAVIEEQQIVFREASAALEAADTSPPRPVSNDSRSFNEVTLFRYSALTFNGHRIHYDRPYAAFEGYPHLVVHAPLQASLLLYRAISENGGRLPREFRFRAVQPLFCGQAFEVSLTRAAGRMELFLSTSDGPSMTARSEL